MLRKQKARHAAAVACGQAQFRGRLMMLMRDEARRIAANIAKLAENCPINKDSLVDIAGSMACGSTDLVRSPRHRRAPRPSTVEMLQPRKSFGRRIRSLNRRTTRRFAPQRVFRYRRQPQELPG